MNYKDKIFEMLGIQPNEPFRLYKNDKIGFLFDDEYSLSEELKLQHRKNKYSVWQRSTYDIRWILDEKLRIKKIPKPISLAEKFAINYFVAAGYNYMAKDKNGKVFAYRKKPYKMHNLDSWQLAIDEKPDSYRPVEVLIDFISWEDSEPFDLNNLSMESIEYQN